MARFLQIAMGSASELEYHFLLARDLELLPVADYERLAGGAIEVKRMLSSLIRKVHADKPMRRRIGCQLDATRRLIADG